MPQGMTSTRGAGGHHLGMPPTCLGLPRWLSDLPIQETWVGSWGWEHPLEKGMATHSNILAWRIPCLEEPGGLQSTGSQKSQTRLSTHACIPTCLDDP